MLRNTSINKANKKGKSYKPKIIGLSGHPV